MSKTKDVDLTILRKLVAELESAVAVINTMKDANAPVADFAVETAKASGLAAGVMQEASLLIGDIQRQSLVTGSLPLSKDDLLGGLLGGLKGGGFGSSQN